MLQTAPKATVTGDYDRRWMSDDYFDLIVWYRPSGAIHGFQLCYGKPRWERALTWIRGRGFSHTEIDAGEDQALKNKAPIMVPDGAFPVEEVMREFERRSRELPGKLRRLVSRKMTQFNGRGFRRTLLSLAVFTALLGVAVTILHGLWQCPAPGGRRKR